MLLSQKYSSTGINSFSIETKFFINMLVYVWAIVNANSDCLSCITNRAFKFRIPLVSEQYKIPLKSFKKMPDVPFVFLESTSSIQMMPTCQKRKKKDQLHTIMIGYDE